MGARLGSLSSRACIKETRALNPEENQTMHASSLENMTLCYRRYIAVSPLEAKERLLVLDVGGADVNGSYRDIFSAPQFTYLAADIASDQGVDIVLEEPNRLPLDDASMDIVLCGQMLEHCEFFWLTFSEMVRVLKPGGYLFLIAPSSGPEHRYPVDCYRFYPDSYRALARYANCRLVDIWLDERGPWKDLVGVFQRHSLPDLSHKQAHPTPHPDFDPATDHGTPEEEVTCGDQPYLEALANLHQTLEPEFYLEIGVRHGRSLNLANCPATGIDPQPEITSELDFSTQLAVMTSDEFFFKGPDRELMPQPPDLVFIDGMHLFEYVLRDFMHVERISRPSTLVVVDDIFPNHPAQAERTRRTRVWTGDVWKFYRLLERKRPDLLLLPINTSPTGLLLIAGLNPGQRVLWEEYNPIVRSCLELNEPTTAILNRRGAVSGNDPLVAKLAKQLYSARRSGQDRAGVQEALLPFRDHSRQRRQT